MRPARIILIFLCLFILKGYNHAFAKKHTHSFKGFPVQLIENKNSLAFSNSQGHDVPVAYSLDEEDDDNDFTAARKKISAPGLISSITILFKNDIPNSFNNKQEFYEHSSYSSRDLYIFQRTIRV